MAPPSVMAVREGAPGRWRSAAPRGRPSLPSRQYSPARRRISCGGSFGGPSGGIFGGAFSVAHSVACARTPEMTVAHFLIHAPATVHCAESIHRGKRLINGKPRAPISAEPITLDWPDH